MFYRSLRRHFRRTVDVIVTDIGNTLRQSKFMTRASELYILYREWYFYI